MLFILIVSLLMNVSLGYVLFVFIKRTLQFDRLFTMIQEDFDTNIEFFENLMKRDIFMNSPEVMTAHKNMDMMKRRLKEYVSYLSDVRKNDLKKIEKNSNPPVVID